jgi:hypothetical protein
MNHGIIHEVCKMVYWKKYEKLTVAATCSYEAENFIIHCTNRPPKTNMISTYTSLIHCKLQSRTVMGNEFSQQLIPTSPDQSSLAVYTGEWKQTGKEEDATWCRCLTEGRGLGPAAVATRKWERSGHLMEEVAVTNAGSRRRRLRSGRCVAGGGDAWGQVAGGGGHARSRARRRAGYDVAEGSRWEGKELARWGDARGRAAREGGIGRPAEAGTRGVGRAAEAATRGVGRAAARGMTTPPGDRGERERS